MRPGSAVDVVLLGSEPGWYADVPLDLPRRRGNMTPSSMLQAPPASLLSSLRDIVGTAGVIEGAERLMAYESDALTQYRRTPRAVVLPRDTSEASRVLKLLHEAGLPVVPRGAGTGLSGGALAENGAVIVGTARMSRILDLDPTNRIARVQPGVINQRLSTAALPHGLYYAPDPSSQSACTLGGNVAENSGGPHCLKYGVTSRYVCGLTLVLPDGEVAELGGAVDPGDRYDLVGLVVGSEGCFGLVSEIEVRLLPLPAGVRTLLGVFDEIEHAGQAVTDLMADGLLPAALEIMDREAIRAVEASVFAAGYPTDAGAILVIEFDGTEQGLDEDVEAAVAHCEGAGATEIRRASNEEERAALWKGRKKAFGAMGRIAPDLLIQDATVPRSQLPDVLRAVGDIGRRYGLKVVNVFHAGDGNLHPKLLFDRRVEGELAKVEAASQEIMQTCVDAGGTITGEHGVGVDKRAYMPMVHSPLALEAMASVKAVFDPEGRFNAGKVLPDGVSPRPVADASGPGLGRERPGGDEVNAVLTALLGGGLVSTGLPSDEEGAPDSPVVTPRDVEQVAAVVRVANERGWRVVPVGSGASPRVRSLRGRAELLISTSALSDVLEYEPADLTISVGAGLSLAALDGHTRRVGQWLPVDPPGAPNATVGGVVATGLGGSLPAAFGRPRDLVLGMTCVTGDGRTVRLGGKVVKNVAGFDLVRLLTGSGGSLGIITDLTVRLYPVPAVDRTLAVRAESAKELVPALKALVAVPLVPAAIDIVETGGAATLFVRVLGREAAVDAECATFRVAAPELEAIASGEALKIRTAVRELEVGSERSLRVVVPPSRVGEAVEELDAWWVSLPASSRGRRVVHGALGVLRGVVPDGLDEAEAARAVAELRARMTGLGGVVGSVGIAGREQAPTDGPIGRITSGLKRHFDPGGVLPQ